MIYTRTTIRLRLLLLLVLLSSLIGYLAWGGGNSTWLGTAACTVVQKLFSDPLAAIHPLTLLPLFGQLLLLTNVLLPRPMKALSYAGITCIGILMLIIFFIGLFSTNLQMTLSTIPFLGLSLALVREHRGRNRQ